MSVVFVITILFACGVFTELWKSNLRQKKQKGWAFYAIFLSVWFWNIVLHLIMILVVSVIIIITYIPMKLWDKYKK